MSWYESLTDLIGDTPLLRLSRITEGISATVLAKLEHLNPGGSVKDRIALRMIEAAERDGRLLPGGTIVEPTSGNTGVGLAIVAALRGYRCVFTCPDKVSVEKRNVLRAHGAEVVVCPAAVPPDHPDSYRTVSTRLAREIPGAVKLDQYATPANRESHYHSTGPEIWAQTEGRITHFVTSVGTGGTISGAGRYLKEVSGGRVRIIGADPDGSVYSGGTGRPYLLEGVGQPGIPASFDPAVPDEILAVHDRDSIETTRRLAREEGLLVGGSSGMAVAAALSVAKNAGPADLIVVLLPDSGRGYLSKIFDDEWLGRFGLTPPEAGRATAAGALGDPAWIALTPTDTVARAVALLAETGRAHLPVTAAPPPVRLAELQGVVSTASLAAALATGRAGPGTPVGEVADPPPPTVGAGQPLDAATAAMADGGVAVVLDAGEVLGLLTGHHVNAHLAGVDAARAHPPEEET
ncbi:cystathionine beta-synthase [Actinorhabdospora filicis]|uniref:Cystathionine beta-synthase n=1 Tax=Actinorhabdospora filicis TaxID=1785913 RepID=A0A9W6SJM8_9ACTN|nr:cystathionine beta-synthase [Actinorhabdospora filicis]GLZ78265.1 cystathionine beta-synthase [Actinorhabdospora filicis]